MDEHFQYYFFQKYHNEHAQEIDFLSMVDFLPAMLHHLIYLDFFLKLHSNAHLFEQICLVSVEIYLTLLY